MMDWPGRPLVELRQSTLSFAPPPPSPTCVVDETERFRPLSPSLQKGSRVDVEDAVRALRAQCEARVCALRRECEHHVALLRAER